tara:strand:- start:510 stop:728 length:219 start_codon:yes stop_codon:yes gene_type:complete
MDLRKVADIYGGIPIFLLLIYYFSKKNNKTNFEYILYLSVSIGFIVDVILSLELIKVRYVTFNNFNIISDDS